MLKQAKKEDLHSILTYVQKQPSENLFIIGDIEDYGLDHPFQKIWYNKTNNVLDLVLLKYHSNFVLASEANSFDGFEVAQICLEHKASFINGLQKIIALIEPHLEERYEKHLCCFCQTQSKEKLLPLDSHCRKATAGDVEIIAHQLMEIAEFKSVDVNFDQRCQTVLECVLSETREAWIYEKQGRILGYCSTVCESSTSGMIGSVYTIQSARNQGIASHLVSTVVHQLIQKGKTACLFYDNPKAGNIYHRLGFESLDQWVMLKRKP